MSEIQPIIAILLVVAVSAAAGLWIGSRLKSAQAESLRSQARSESAIEIAQLQTRAAFLDQQSQDQQQEINATSATLRIAEGELSKTLQDSARLQERIIRADQTEADLTRLRADLTATEAALSDERQLVAQISAQLHAANERIERLEVACATGTEHIARLQEDLATATNMATQGA